MSQADGLGDLPMEERESASSGTFTLQVVSPSVGVSGPLSFPQLSPGTTVKQLKEKIRESLPMRPSDDQQRLIHRGRLLAKEGETLLEIFGQDTIKTSKSQTLHLVLKPSISETSSIQNTASVPPQQAAPPAQQGPHPPYYFRLPPPPPLPESLRQTAVEARQQAVNLPVNTGPVREIRIPTPPQSHAPPVPPPTGVPNEQAGLNPQRPLQNLNAPASPLTQAMDRLEQRIARLYPERLNQQHPLPGMPANYPNQNPVHQSPLTPPLQHLVAQHYRDRSALGMHSVHMQQQGLQQGSNAMPSAPRPGHSQIQPNRVVHRPQQTRTSTHEVDGPDGQRWTVRVNETTTFFPNPSGAPFPAPPTPEASSLRDVQDIVQNIVRAVDGNTNVLPNLTHHHGINSGNPSPSARTNEAAHRPASAPPPETSSPAHAPTIDARASSEHLVPTINNPSNAPTLSGPMVYILSSPTGPRGLLVSPSQDGMEAFYTPRRQVHWDTAHQTPQPQNRVQAQNDAVMGLPEVRNRREGRRGQAHPHGYRHVEAGARMIPGVAHPGNRPAGAVAAQMWPHIWLVVRLLGFVWFFTSGSNSWWRFFVFSAVAFIIFIASTGILNGIFEQVWGPIRRHLESLLPLAAPHAPQARQPNQPVGAPAPAQGQAGRLATGPVVAPGAPPDPAETAARLLEQRRAADENWIWTQFRRLEHATILFVASLVPGVGERHIAARVAEENLLLEAQRQRREAEAAAAEEAARTTTDTDTTGFDTDTTDAEENSASAQDGNEHATGGSSTAAVEAPAQPLIEV